MRPSRIVVTVVAVAVLTTLAGCTLYLFPRGPAPAIGEGTWVNTDMGVKLVLYSDGTGMADAIHASNGEACSTPEAPSYVGPLKWSQSQVEPSLANLTIYFEVRGEFAGRVFSDGADRADPHWSQLTDFPCGDPDTTYPIILTRVAGANLGGPT